MGWKEFTGKTVEEAITNACTDFVVPSDKLEVDVLEKESKGFLGLFGHEARIRARLKEEADKEEALAKAESPVKAEPEKVKTASKKEPVKSEPVKHEPAKSEPVKHEPVKNEPVKREQTKNEPEKLESVKPEVREKRELSERPAAKELTKEEQEKIKNTASSFLNSVFEQMQLKVALDITYQPSDVQLDINVEGDDMGILIGKRGQTLDSLQYLVSLVVNKETSCYVKVKLDTENYRQRRKETLENLAKNIAFKVKRTRHSVTLEPMNPYERRIIHSALQHDKFVETHSEGEEPFRKVVVTLKDGYNDYNRGGRGNYRKNNYHKNYRNRRPAHNENQSASSGDTASVQSEE